MLAAFGAFYAPLNNWLNYYTLVLNLKLAVYLVFIFFLFVLLWWKMVSSMKSDIAKTVCMLGILPTTHLAGNPEFIKKLNASSLVN